MSLQITAMTNAVALTGTEKIHGVQSGNSRAITLNQVKTFVAPPAFTVTTDATAGHVATSGEFNGSSMVLMDYATANTFTVNTGLSPLGPLTVAQRGAGQTSFVAGAGVTIVSADGKMKLRVVNSSATLVPIGTDTYLLIGDIAA